MKLLVFVGLLCSSDLLRAQDCPEYEKCYSEPLPMTRPPPNWFASCSCGTDCLQLGDCCSDFFEPTRSGLNLSDWSYMLSVLGPSLPAWPGLLKSSCDSNWPQNGDYVRTNCEQLGISKEQEFLLPQFGHLLSIFGQNFDQFLIYPVTSNVTKISYRNLYCAVCNFEKEHLQSWEQTINCLTSAGSAKFCTKVGMAYPPKAVIQAVVERNRKVFAPHIISGCNLAWFSQRLRIGQTRQFAIDTYKQCSAIYAPITGLRNGQTVNFKNSHCAHCNGFQSSELKCPSQDPRITNVQLHDASFVVRFDTDVLEGGNHGLNESLRCQPGSVFDPFRLECRLIVQNPTSTQQQQQQRPTSTDRADSEVEFVSARKAQFDDDIGDGLDSFGPDHASIHQATSGHPNISTTTSAADLLPDQPSDSSFEGSDDEAASTGHSTNGRGLLCALILFALLVVV